MIADLEDAPFNGYIISIPFKINNSSNSSSKSSVVTDKSIFYSKHLLTQSGLTISLIVPPAAKTKLVPPR